MNVIGFVVFLLVGCSEDDPWAIDETSETPYTDLLSAPEHEGKTFLTDGVGDVSLHACRDGDTADFIEDNEIFRVRFLGTDTPESGHLYEPWGIEASTHVCEALMNADHITLEAETPQERGNFGRYLGYVWADDTLLNIETIDLGYSTATGVANLKYGDAMFRADVRSQELNLGVYGRENDPYFPYDSSVRDVSIETLRLNQDNPDYLLHHFNVEGIVTARFGAHVWIEDAQRENGIFLFAHYHNFTSDLAPGNKVRLSGAQFYHNGKPYDSSFLTDYANIDIEVLDTDLAYDLHEIDIKDITPTHSGLYARFENLTITAFDDLTMTFYAEDDTGHSIAVHQFGEDYISNSLWPRSFRLSAFESIDERTLDVGDVISFNAIIKDTNDFNMALILLGDDHFELSD